MVPDDQDSLLYGRHKERAVIAGLLAEARQGRGGALVIRGEAGIGKHTLLQDAANQATGFRLLRATGVEAEVELPFAALHQLLGPILDRLDRVPDPQATALRGAFGLVDPETEINRFLVELGALSLLAVVAAEQPLLCLIGQARWLDPDSADTLVFVARRLELEPMVLLFAARDGEVRQFLAPGLPELHLGGLDAAAAAELLAARVGPLDPAVRERLISETGGNPLALLELPAALTSQQLAGREPLPERLPLTARLAQGFLARVRTLPAETQRLLLVAAAEDTGELATILAAVGVLGVDKEALGPAEQAGLVQVTGSQLVFRHPLVRSAIYQDTTLFARRAAHRALVEVLTSTQQADRRAWHLAAATLGPNEGVAGALAASADRARRRGGPAAAAAALERAAALTPEVEVRARRLVAAAEDLWEAGHTSQARALLDRVDPGLADASVRARVAYVRGAIELAAGTPTLACTPLLEGARLTAESDPAQATEMLVLAARAALAAGELDILVHQIHPAVARLNARRPEPDDVRVQRVADSLLAAGLVPGPPAATTIHPPRETATSWPDPAFTWMWPMLIVAQPTGAEVTADQRYAEAVAARRAAGTVSSLLVALANLALAEGYLGRWPSATSSASEGLRLATETGQHATGGYFVALLASFAAEQGRVEDCWRLAEEALTVARRLGLAVVAAFAAWTLATLELTEGRPGTALERLLLLSTPQHPTAHAAIALLATGTLVEAAARAGRLEEIQPRVARFEQWARQDPRTWTQVIARRCRALISDGQEAERQFQAALAVEGLGALPFELARTKLAYGEWLRRARRRADARPHLRAALELFERLDASPWADQARTELRATGETARQRDPSTLQDLTPQERQIAGLAGQGLSNQQIADRLFLSTHTVGYHLHKVYAKLGIASRGALGQLDLDDAAR
jgi:DNA-binding CsgD family transcriptional regulator